MYSPAPPPPIPPPKPSSHDTSRLGTPTTTLGQDSSRPPPPIPDGSYSQNYGGGSGLDGGYKNNNQGKAPATVDDSGLIPAPTSQAQQPAVPEDPGENWLPRVLEDKSKQDLADILSNPALLDALTHSPSTIHPSLAATRDSLHVALSDNVGLATHLRELEARLSHQRSSAQAQLLSTHALERQWRGKQAEMDNALLPFAPTSLYARLAQAVQEQEMICRALEESFLDGGGGGGARGEGEVASEREILDWVRRYRDAKKLYYLRQERKERWNERRVGGWR